MSKKERIIDQMMTDSFDDAIIKSVNDAGDARLSVIEMFSGVLEWDHETIVTAVMMSIGEEAIEAAHHFCNHGTKNDHIEFIEAFADNLKTQVRGRYEKS